MKRRNEKTPDQIKRSKTKPKTKTDKRKGPSSQLSKRSSRLARRGRVDLSPGKSKNAKRPQNATQKRRIKSRPKRSTANKGKEKATTLVVVITRCPKGHRAVRSALQRRLLSTPRPLLRRPRLLVGFGSRFRSRRLPSEDVFAHDALPLVQALRRGGLRRGGAPKGALFGDLLEGGEDHGG